MKTHLKRNRFPLPFWAGALAWLLSSVLVTLIVIYLQPGVFRESMEGILKTPALILLNGLPALVLVGVLFGVTGNVFAGAAVSALVLELLSYANLLKLEGRNDPLVPADITLLRESLQAAGEYDLNLHPFYIGVIAASVLCFALLAVFFPIKRPHWCVRVGACAALLGVLVACMLTIYPSKTYYENLPDVSKSNVPLVYNTYGFLYCFLHNWNLYPVDKPEGYQAATVEQWETETLEADEPLAVNLIFVMGEAFTDLSDEDAFTWSQEDNPIYLYHQLADSDQAISGHLVVSGFGAGTANTEFDVLTGMQTDMLSENTTSAFRVVHRNIDSLARLYSGAGYTTFMMHPGQNWFYNRCSVYPFLGISDMTFMEAFTSEDYNGNYISDAAFGRMLQSMISDRASSGELFAFTVTIENHQAYRYVKYAEAPEITLETDLALTADAEEYLTVYFQGAANTSQMLAQLADYLNEQEEPFLLVFFGDHRPNLGADYLSYREIGSAVGQEDSVDSILYTYSTPYLIWANDALYQQQAYQQAAAGLELPEGGLLSANYLGAVVYELTGRRGTSAYWDYLTQARRILPVLHKGGYYALPDGTATTELTEEQAQTAEKLHWWEYYRLKTGVSE